MKNWIFAIALIPQVCLGNASDAMSYYLDQDYEKAFSLFEQTAELGDGRSQFNLAVQYLRGQGVAADPIKAYAYFTLAIDNDFKMAEQARKSVIRRLNKNELKQAKALAQQLIVRFGKSGTQTLFHELSRTLTYNPLRERTVNPPTEYPSDLQSQGIPGIASYVFDIDEMGMPRDMVLVSSYPAPEFGQSIAEKLEDTRFNSDDAVFSNGIVRGVFAGADENEFTAKLRARADTLLAQAKRDDVNAQAELALLLRLLDAQAERYAVDESELLLTSTAPQLRFSSITQPEFERDSTIETNFFNFGYLVNITAEGKAQQWQSVGHHGIPKKLTEQAENLMESWVVSALQNKLSDDNWYYARFFYNNKNQDPSYLNYSVNAYVDLTPVVNRAQERQWQYWQYKAAVGGHSDTLFELGLNCNLRLLTAAAIQEHVKAQAQLGKCLMAQADESTVYKEQAKYWLQKATDNGDVIAMRKLARWYVLYSDKPEELELAIKFAEQVADSNDHPMAYAYLAAAHAKLGNFEQAISFQQQAVDEADDQAFDTSEFQQALAAYEQNKLIF
ncbi:hypothetical protein AAEU32_06930 [Pseudoalteromonas sp. SSDWG2]|uniref:tetratricopeptide repeat protein n=1 Tax=Pseudoalteromonas sp. SSDWG2 TaxID=3139391 RepID=UPI003BA9FAF8